jgi:hypothetical protein
MGDDGQAAGRGHWKFEISGFEIEGDSDPRHPGCYGEFQEAGKIEIWG